MATHLCCKLNEQKTCYDLLLAAWGNKCHTNVACRKSMIYEDGEFYWFNKI